MVSRWRVALLGLVSACSASSFDEDVFPKITSAAISVDASQPAALANVQVAVDLKAGPTADRVVELHSVTLNGAQTNGDSDILATLDLAFPPEFDGTMHEDDVRSLTLVNATTNQQLAAHCGEKDALVVRLTYPDHPGTRTYSSPFAVAINCP